MAGAVTDITTIISAIKKLYDLGKTIEGNYKRCDLLIQRCSLFEDELAKIDTKSSKKINVKALNQLNTAVEDCIVFVKKYGGRGWKTLCLQSSTAKGIETEFKELNNSLHQASSDLSFSILLNSVALSEETDSANHEDFNASIDVSGHDIRCFVFQIFLLNIYGLISIVAIKYFTVDHCDYCTQ